MMKEGREANNYAKFQFDPLSCCVAMAMQSSKFHQIIGDNTRATSIFWSFFMHS